MMRRTKERGVVSTFMLFIRIPLDFLRDYTCPMAEKESWDRNRAAILPLTMITAFFYLGGDLNSDSDSKDFYWKISAFSLLPGGLLALLVRLKTKRSVAPPKLLTVYAMLSFVMSIVWIQFTSNCIIDMLKLLGFITKLPRALFGLTILAWGNCLGDMSADMAMTKKGFGEMAITGTMAGPIFNILVGQGLSCTLKLLNSENPWKEYIKVSIFLDKDDGSRSFNHSAVLPLALIVAQLVILGVNLMNALRHKFEIRFQFTLISSFIYICVIILLVAYSIINAIVPSED